MLARRNHQPAGGETAFDARGGMNLQCARGDQFANETAFDDGLTHQSVRVEDIAFFLDHQAAMRPEVLGDGLCDPVVGQVHVAAASFAQGGGGGRRHGELRAALETADLSLLELGFCRLGRQAPHFLQAKMLVALLADGGVTGARLQLEVPAPGAGYRDPI